MVADIDPNLKRELDDVEAFEHEDLIQQINSEYELCEEYLDPKRKEWEVRMRLYNNQRRNKEATGDPLLFTIMQTLLASLYDNKLSATFMGREHGDVEVANNLTALARYDYEQMEKDRVDYDWDWDSCFYGKGFILLSEFDRESMTPRPHILDPMTLFHDPRAISMDGYWGRGAARFWGREILMTKREMRENPAYFNIDEVIRDSDIDDVTQDAHEARADMQGADQTDIFEDVDGENELFRLLEWYTYVNGKKHVVTLANNMSTVVRKQELKNQATWGVIERQIYPVSNSFWGTSVPDLVEDKQRLRAKLQNIAAKGVEFGVYPMYMYDNGRVTNISEITRPAPNKLIGIDGEVGNAIQPIQKDQVNQDVQWMMNLLNMGAEKATASPAIQQGATPDTMRTAKERALQQQAVDARYGLAAKLFGNSEKKFWRQWHHLYKQHFKKFDEKVLRIAGGLGYEFRKLTRDNIVGLVDPDIKVEDSVISESEKLSQLQALSNVSQIVAQNPRINRDGLDRELLRLSGLDNDKLNMIFPKTSEELRASEENKLLNENKAAKISIEDDHMKHLEIHNQAADTPAKRAHMKMHHKAMMQARTMKDQLPVTDQGIAGVPADQQPQLGPGPTPGNQQDQSQISPTALNFNTPQ